MGSPQKNTYPPAMHPEHTSVLIKNLPNDIDAQSLGHYLRECFKPPTCVMEFLHDGGETSTRKKAKADLGKYEKAQQAIRDLNYKVLRGRILKVSLVSEPPSSRACSVYLAHFLNPVTNVQLFDIMSKFGCIAEITMSFSKDRVQNACIKYLKKDQAEKAIQEINSHHHGEFPFQIVANNRVPIEYGKGEEMRKNRGSGEENGPSDVELSTERQVPRRTLTPHIGNPPPPDRKMNKKEKKRAATPEVSSEATRPTGSDIQHSSNNSAGPNGKKNEKKNKAKKEEKKEAKATNSDQPTSNIASTASVATDEKSMPKKLSNRERRLQQKEKRNKVVTVLTKPSASNAALESYEFKRTVDAHTNWTEVSVNKEGIQSPPLVQAAMKAKDKMDVASELSDEGKAKLIHDRMLQEVAKNHPARTLKEICATWMSLDTAMVLELCEDTKELRLGMFHALVALEKKQALKIPPLSDMVNNLILELNLDALDSTSAWIEALMQYLLKEHEQCYDVKQCQRSLDNLLRDPSYSTSVYSLLNFCADERQLRMAVLHDAAKTGRVLQIGNASLSKEVEELALRLRLDKRENVADWMQPVQRYLHRTYERYFHTSDFPMILEKMFNGLTLTSTTDWFDFLQKTLEKEQFLFCLIAAQFAYKKGIPGTLEPPSSAALSMVEKLKLAQYGSIDKRIDRIREHLLQVHQSRYGIDELKPILDKIFNNFAWVHDFSHIIELCTDERPFRVLVFQAKVAILRNKNTAQTALSAASEDLLLRLELDKIDALDGFKQILRSHLFGAHVEQYGVERLHNILDKMLGGFVSASHISQFLESCAQSSNFLLYALLAEIANKTQDRLTVLPVIGLVMNQEDCEVLDLCHDVNHLKQIFRKRLVHLYEEQYGAERLSKVLDRIIDALHGPSQFFELFLSCKDSFRFRIHAIIAEFSMGIDETSHFGSISNSAMALAWQLKLDKHDYAVEWKRFMRDHLVKKHENRYGKGPLLKILDKIFESSTSSDVYNQLEICVADAARFAAYSFVVEYSTILRRPFSFIPVSDSVAEFVQETDLSSLNSVNQWTQAIRKQLVALQEGVYGRERLKKILEGIISALEQQSNFSAILETVSDKNRFHVYAVVAESANANKRAFKYKPVSDTVVNFVLETKLFTLKGPGQWLEKLKRLLTRLHEDLFGRDLLKAIIKHLFGALDSQLDFYDFLEICSDANRFLVYAIAGQIAIENDMPVPFSEPISDAVLEFVKRKKIYGQIAASNWKKPILDHLIAVLKEYCTPFQLGQILNNMIAAITSPALVFKILSIFMDLDQLFFFAAAADYAIETKQSFTFASLSDEAIWFIRKAKLSSFSGAGYWLQTFREHLTKRHEQKYASMRLKSVLDTIFGDTKWQSKFYDILQLCADENAFRLLMFHDQAMSLYNAKLDSLPISSDAECDLILTLELDKMESIAQVTKALWKHVIGRHADYYGKEALDKILTNIFHSLTSTTDLYEILAACSDEKKFRDYLRFQESMRIDQLGSQVLPISVVGASTIMRNKINQIQDIHLWKETLREYLSTSYVERYGRKQLQNILDKIFDASTLIKDRQRFFDLCTNEEQFRLLAFHSKIAIQDNSKLFEYPLSHTAVDFILEHNLDNVDSTMSQVRKYLEVRFCEGLGKERLERILSALFGLNGQDELCGSLYELVEIAADANLFDTYAYLTQWHSVFGGNITRSRKLAAGETGLLRKVKRLDMSYWTWMGALQKRLMLQYQEQYGRQRLWKSLRKIIDEEMCCFTLLEICSDADRFRFHEAIAHYCVQKRHRFFYRPISDNTLARFKELHLHGKNSFPQYMAVLRDSLIHKHKQHYNMKRLCMILDEFSGANVPPENLYKLMDLGYDDNQFRLLAFQALIAIETKSAFARYQPSNLAQNLILNWNLDRARNLSHFKQLLLDYLTQAHGGLYRSGKLEKIIDTIFGRFTAISEFYDFLELCQDITHFRTYVAVAQLSIASGSPFAFLRMSQAARKLVCSLNLDQIETVEDCEGLLREYLYQANIKLHPEWIQVQVLKKFYATVTSIPAFYRFLETCVDWDKFLAKYPRFKLGKHLRRKRRRNKPAKRRR